jgi:hypothetical protein
LGIVVLPILALVPLWLLDLSIPRHTRSVLGTVVMFETTADESAVWYSVTVNLDDGGVVHAKNPMKATTVVGSRVRLLETSGLLTGMRRYRLQQVLQLQGSGAPGEALSNMAMQRAARARRARGR